MMTADEKYVHEVMSEAWQPAACHDWMDGQK